MVKVFERTMNVDFCMFRFLFINTFRICQRDFLCILSFLELEVDHKMIKPPKVKAIENGDAKLETDESRKKAEGSVDNRPEFFHTESIISRASDL